MEFMRQFLLAKGVPVSEENWKIFTDRNKRKTFRKKELILQEGQVDNHLTLIESGAARLFFNKEHKELTIRFVFQYQYLTAYDSFLQRSPSRCNIEALTDMVVWQIHYDDLQTVYELSSVGNLIGRLTIELIYIDKLNREFSFLSESAEERYIKLMKEQPALFQMIPLKHIASYMGITPQALSRIRKRIS